MDETTLEALKRLDPKHQYHMDPVTGRIHAEVDELEMAIEDPFTSECGRFPCTPDYYGIPTKAALCLVRHNMELPTLEEMEDA